MLVLMSALMMTTFNGVPVVSQGESVPSPYGLFEKYGPRVDRLIWHVSGSVVAEVGDFEAGLIDIMDWAAPADKWDNWLANPEITMGDFGEFAPIYLALNTMRWPLGHGDQYPEGWTSYPSGYFDASGHSPSLWSDGTMKSDLPVGTAEMTWVDYDNCQRCNDSRWFRRGLAHMVDRATQIAYMEGAGTSLSPSLFWPEMKSWEAPGLVEYDYDLLAAAAAFEAGGFKDWDGNDGGIMEYSPGHDGSVIEELPTLQFYTRIDDDHRTHLGQLISFDMDLLGIPHNLYIASYGTVSTKVWQQYDYDIYIEYWPWDAVPDFYAEWFMSKKDIYPTAWGDNQHRYHSKEFDAAADHFIAGDSPGVDYWCDEMQYIIHDDAVVVPVYSYVGYNAHRTKYGSFPGEAKYAGKPWAGINNFPGEGFYNYGGAWTQLNAHPEGFEKGGSLRIGLNLNPDLLDIMDSMYWYEGIILNQIYETPLKSNPWDLSKYEPWLVSSYAEGTWAGGTKSAINFTLIPGILWQDGEPMTARDIQFSIEFGKELKSPTYYLYVKDYNSSIIYTDPVTGVETIEIRFNVKSWLAPAWAGFIYVIPEHIWSDEYQRYCPVHKVYEYGPGVSGSPAYDPEEHDALIGTGPFRFYRDNIVGRVDRVPMEYVYMEYNPLYFRKYIWPDVCDNTFTAGNVDEWVSLDDFMQVAVPGIIFAREDDNGNWPGTYDPDTNPTGTLPGAWGEYCDVNRDGKIGVADLMEVGVHAFDQWPPDYYEWSAGFPP